MLAAASTQREAQIFAGADSFFRQQALDGRKIEIKRLLIEKGIGGLICFQGSPTSQIELLPDLEQGLSRFMQCIILLVDIWQINNKNGS